MMPTTQHSHDDFASLDVDEGLARWGNRELYQRFLGKFSQDYKDFEKQLRTCSTSEAQSSLHQLKGVAGNLSLTGLHHLAMELEQLADKDELSRHLIRLETTLNQTLTRIEHYLTSTASPERIEPDWDRASTLLNEMRSILEDDDIDKATELLNELANCVTPDQTKPLRNALDSFMVSEAIEAVEMMMEQIKRDHSQ